MRRKSSDHTSEVTPDDRDGKPERSDPEGIEDLRLTYTAGRMLEADLAPTPLVQFQRWFDDALGHAAVVEANAVVLATADGAGRPSTRTVLLKGLDGDGFRFFTNLTSRKGREVAANPSVSLLFGWHPLQRQVAVRGRAEPLARAAVAEYFVSRPYGSRIGAWASHQSAPVDGREPIERREAELRDRWPDTGSSDDVPVPEHWGGFVVHAEEVEFWQGRPSRLHDRLVFVALTGTGRLDVAADWRVERRWP